MRRCAPVNPERADSNGLERRRLRRSEDAKTRATARVFVQTAEGEGFEPSIRLTTDNGFRDRRIRPLCHPSEEGQSSRASPGRRLSCGPRRSGRVAEGGALLRRYGGELLHRGFESLLLRLD